MGAYFNGNEAALNLSFAVESVAVSNVHTEEHVLAEAVERYFIPLDTTKYFHYQVIINQPSNAVSTKVGITREKRSSLEMKDAGTAQETCYLFSIIETRLWNDGTTKTLWGHTRRSNNMSGLFGAYGDIRYATTEENGISVLGSSLPAGTKICVRCWE